MGDDQQDPLKPPQSEESAQTSSRSRTAAPGAEDHRLPRYVARSPERRKWRRGALRLIATRGLRRAVHLFKHAISTFEDAPTHPRPITTSSPKGVFTADWLPAALEIERKADSRHEKLEQKATVMLSVLAVLAPIIVSAIVFSASHPTVPRGVYVFAVMLGIGAMAAVLLAFIAALRTLAVRAHQEILVGGLVEDQRVREYDDDFRIRGILWTAANRQANNDHIADFLRASQMFLGAGITMVLVVGTAVLPFAGERAPQRVEGTMALDRATVEAAGAAIAKGIEPLVRQIDEVGEQLDSLPTAARFDSLTIDVQRLQAEIAEARRGGQIR